ncbi:MAG: M18 family aminopeptidase [Clostridia bacterium]|nr:M18 family aminopeptidase [Clostridia bacterium]
MYIQGLKDFLQNAPSAFHAIDEIVKTLEKAGFSRLKESEKWSLVPGGKYYVTRNLSSVIAFQAPKDGKFALRIAASHSDSPVFKIKENAEIDVRGKYVLLNTERYGGMIFSTWLDKPLSVAGRVLVKTEKGVETRLVNIDRDLLVIPNVAIHMNRSVNEGYKYNPQTDLTPLFGDNRVKGGFKKLIAESAGVSEEDVLGSDLYLYSRVSPSVWGLNDEFISSARLDDLECAYTTVQALIEANAESGMPVAAVFDNEEVGSTTKQGADSTFLTDVIKRAVYALGGDEEAFMRLASASVMLSCDNAHAMHPNHPEFSDSTNTVYMNGGIVIKESANQKYTSDGASKAILRSVLSANDVPFQFFANRSDMLGGGTLGNISNSHFSLNTVDIGLAQLSMHSSWETAGTEDVGHMIRGVKAFYETPVQMNEDGEFLIG